MPFRFPTFLAIALAAVAVAWWCRPPDRVALPPAAASDAAATTPFRSADVAGPLRFAPVLSDERAPTRTIAEQVAEIQDAFTSLSIARLDFALTRLLPELVRADAAAAARLAESIDSPELRAEVLHWVAIWWGEKNPEAALAWASALKIGYEREAALTEATGRLAENDPAKALQLAASSFRADETSAALESFAQHWGEKDLPAALNWTRTLSPGAQRDTLLAHLAFVAAQEKPVAAARLVAEELPPGVIQNEAALAVLHQWAQRDFSAASSWVLHFPESALRDRAVAELKAVARFRLVANAR
jgi:hypothetical protein